MNTNASHRWRMAAIAAAAALVPLTGPRTAAASEEWQRRQNPQETAERHHCIARPVPARSWQP
ncbi:MAG: hypothetical protein ACT4UP_01360 [Gammaproteobacteria bacterium]